MGLPCYRALQSVASVVIGGQTFTTASGGTGRTDPLNPDTDGDGLLDGEEGEFGLYFGDNENFNPDGNGTSVVEGVELIIFNNGYVHPLDADTDDDSYEQQMFSDGSVKKSPQNKFLMDMTDGQELLGFDVVMIPSIEPWEGYETGDILER